MKKLTVILMCLIFFCGCAQKNPEAWRSVDTYDYMIDQIDEKLHQPTVKGERAKLLKTKIALKKERDEQAKKKGFKLKEPKPQSFKENCFLATVWGSIVGVSVWSISKLFK